MAREVLGVTGAIIGGIYGGPAGAQLGFMIGSTVGSIIDGPEKIPGPKLGEAPVQTSRDGIPIPIIWGINHVVGNIVAINPIVETTKKVSSKKGGTETTETHRTRTFAIGICRGPYGPIGGILRCWENNKLIYDVRQNSTFPYADNRAFEESTAIYLGAESQEPDPELEAHSGVGTTPSYRGLAYIVFYNKDITFFGSSVPTYRFEITTGIIATSLPYPLFGVDTQQDVLSIPGSSIASWEPATITEDYGFISGTLTHVISYSYYTQGLDTITEDYGFLSGTLTQIIDYVAYDIGEDYITEDYGFLSGTLTTVIGYIDITAPPEELEEDMTILSITLT